MKKKYLFIEFILFFFLLVIPPLLATSETPLGLNSGAFSWTPLFEQLLISVLLTVQYVKVMQTKTPQCSKVPFYALSKGTITLGMLLIVYTIIETVSFFIPSILHNSISKAVEMPVSVISWIHFITGIFVSAFYEEALYRQFMPEISLLLIQYIHFKSEKQKQWIKNGIEGIWILIFAFSHLYIGIPAVLNALFCGIILRRCFKSTGNLLAGTLAHFTYNSLLVTFYFLCR